MKIKILMAYEIESSITIRLNPKRIVNLLSKIPTDVLYKILYDFKLYTNTFHTNKRQNEVGRLISFKESDNPNGVDSNGKAK